MGIDENIGGEIEIKSGSVICIQASVQGEHRYYKVINDTKINYYEKYKILKVRT